MAILQVKNENGKWINIPAVVGPQGPEGPAGANGYTPIKGTDYFTTADKNEIVGLVKEDLTNAGYQTEAQVNALISAALGNIVVAEDGAY